MTIGYQNEALALAIQRATRIQQDARRFAALDQPAVVPLSRILIDAGVSEDEIPDYLHNTEPATPVKEACTVNEYLSYPDSRVDRCKTVILVGLRGELYQVRTTYIGPTLHTALAGRVYDDDLMRLVNIDLVRAHMLATFRIYLPDGY